MSEVGTQDREMRTGVTRNQSVLNNIAFEARQQHQLLSYPRKPALVLALLHILIGATCIALMSVHVYDCYQGCKAVFWVIGYGIWSGVLFIFTGSFGLWTSTHSYRGTVIFYSILCVVTACECCLPFSFAVCDSVYSPFNRSDTKTLWRVMIYLIAVLSLLEALLTIISAILCFRTVCHKKIKRNKTSKNSGN